MKNIFWSAKFLANSVLLYDVSEEDKKRGKILFDFLKADESMESARETILEALFHRIDSGTYNTADGFHKFFNLSEIAARRMYKEMGAKKVVDLWILAGVPWYKYFTYGATRHCAYLLTCEFEASAPENKR